MLYLINDETSLAGQAFSNAQILDPDWSRPWIGQALILMKNDTNPDTFSEELLELLQHSVDLSSGTIFEANYWFAQKSYRKIISKKEIPKPEDLVLLTYALLKCAEHNEKDLAALNLLGLVSELQGLYQQAANSFSKAINLLEQTSNRKSLERVKINYARVLCAQSQFEDSIKCYNQIREQTIDCKLGLGISLFFGNQLEQSMKEFESAISLSSSANYLHYKNDAILLICQVLYALGTVEHRQLAKEELFKLAKSLSGQESEKSVMSQIESLVKLSVIGIKEKDINLAAAALGDLSKINPVFLSRYDHSLVHPLLFSSFYSLQGLHPQAILSLTKAVTKEPWKSIGWCRLAAYQIQHNQDNIKKNNGLNIAHLLSKTSILISSPVWSAVFNESTHLSEQYQLLSLSSLCLGKHLGHNLSHVGSLRSSILNAQKAVMIRPNEINGWIEMGLGLNAKLSYQFALLNVTGSLQQLPEVEKSLNSLQLILQFIDEKARSLENFSAEQKLLYASWARLMLSESFVLRASLYQRGSVERQQLLNQAYSLTEEISKQINLQLQTKNDNETGLNEYQTLGLFQIGRILITMGEIQPRLIDNGIKIFKDLINNRPNFEPAWQELSEEYVRQKKYEAGEYVLKTSLKKGSQRSHFQFVANLRLARIAWLRNDLEKVLMYAGRSIQINPNSAAARWIQGLVHLKNANYSKALRDLNHAKINQSDSLFLNLALSLTYKQKGENQNATSHLNLEKSFQPHSLKIASKT